MVNVIIIHSSYGSPDENWLPWLKAELEKDGHDVYVPKFPTPEGQSLENWLKVFEKYERFLNEDAVLIGHSIGPGFILNVLENLEHPVRACFFVAGFLGRLDNPDFDGINKTFIIGREFDWKKIKQNCVEFHVYASDNDPYVPPEKGRELAGNLGVQLNVIKNAGHFNRKANYTKFELLLNDIRETLQ